MNKPPETVSSNSLKNNSPENLFAFLQCPKCKENTFMQKSATFYKCHSCEASADIENKPIWDKVPASENVSLNHRQHQPYPHGSSQKIAVQEKEQSSGDFLRSFSGMVFISVILIAFISVLSSQRVENTTEYPANVYHNNQ